jgi:glycosyltransferase involved in cell wall biosynthesis
MREKISACIITYNEEENIRRCIDSVTWCDEIVVVDSFSKDRTCKICREYTERIYQNEWAGYIAQRNYIRKLATHPWVFFLDADEEVSAALREEIERAFEQGNADVDGYEFPRQVYYLGKWIRHGEWYPDIKLRLFRKDRGRSCGVEPHDQVHVDGEIKRLRSPILHYTYLGIFDHLNTMNRFSSISAHAKHAQGFKFRWIDFLVRPPWRFFRAYILRLGLLDGLRGFMIALINAFGVSMKYGKLWEEEWRHAEHDPTSGPARGDSKDYTRKMESFRQRTHQETEQKPMSRWSEKEEL